VPVVAPVRILRGWVDPLVVLILSALLLGLLLPARGTAADVLDVLRTAAVVLLFFLYGARMSTEEIRAGLRNWRLQGSMLAATYVAFPLLGLLAQLLPDTLVAPEVKTGLLYLSLLPSTVQASIVFTSVARGNVAGAITGATISNLVGIVLTPLLVGLLLVRTTGGVGNPAGILLQLLLPFAVGRLLHRWIGPWVRAHARLTRVADRGSIVLIAYASVSAATVSGAWAHVTWLAVVVLVVVCAVMLASMLVLTWTGGGRLGLDRPDRIALLMCGSKKSLATGLPMAAVLFSPTLAASVALPVIVFHQLQLATCAVLARRLASQVE
jgi:sodium/bile acid cotransporter 7